MSKIFTELETREPYAWVLLKTGGMQPDDQTEYTEIVLVQDIENMQPDIDRYIEFGRAIPLYK